MRLATSKALFLISIFLTGVFVRPISLHAESTIIFLDDSGSDFVPFVNPTSGDSSNVQLFDFDRPPYQQKGYLKSVTLKFQILDEAVIEDNSGFFLKVARAGDFASCQSINLVTGGGRTLQSPFEFKFEFDSSCSSAVLNFGEGMKLYSWGVGLGSATGYQAVINNETSRFWQTIEVDGDAVIEPPEVTSPSGTVIYDQRQATEFVPIKNPGSPDITNVQEFNPSQPEYAPHGILSSIDLELRVDSQDVINDGSGFTLQVVRSGDFALCISTNAVSGRGRVVGQVFRFRFNFDPGCTGKIFDLDKGSRLYSWGRSQGSIVGYSLGYSSDSGTFWQVIATNGETDDAGDKTNSDQDPPPNVETPSTHTPVLVVPGIMGTELRKGGTLLWPDMGRMLVSLSDDFMDPLIYRQDDLPPDVGVRVGSVVGRVGPPGADFDYSDGLVASLESEGYEQGKDLFLFPYDWRRDIHDVALVDELDSGSGNNVSLAQTIDSILAKTDSSKLDIIAHSQGGLVVKRLLYELPQFRGKINVLLLVGVPHLGSPQAAKALLFGDSMGVAFGPAGLSSKKVQEISQNMPSAYELLPSPGYFGSVPGYIANVEVDPRGHESANFLDYPRTLQMMSNVGLNKILLKNSEQFHASTFDRLELGGNPRVISIIGCATPTITTLGIRPGGARRILYGAGDGTVPVVSSFSPVGSSTYYDLDGSLQHGSMLSDEGIKTLLTHIVAVSSDPFSAPLTTDKSKCSFRGTQIDVHGQAASVQLLDANGDLVHNAEGVVSTTIGDDTSLFIPDPDNYSIGLVGTADGVIDAYQSDISEGEIIGTKYYHALLFQEGQRVLLNGIVPSAVLTSDQSEDLSAPQSSVEVEEREDGSRLFFTASDTGALNKEAAGVLEIDYEIDGEKGVVTSTVGDMMVTAPGEHILTYYAIDRAGNRESVHTKHFFSRSIATASGSVRSIEGVAQEAVAGAFDAGLEPISGPELREVIDDNAATSTSHGLQLSVATPKGKERGQTIQHINLQTSYPKKIRQRMVRVVPSIIKEELKTTRRSIVSWVLFCGGILGFGYAIGKWKH